MTSTSAPNLETFNEAAERASEWVSTSLSEVVDDDIANRIADEVRDLVTARLFQVWTAHPDTLLTR